MGRKNYWRGLARLRRAIVGHRIHLAFRAQGPAGCLRSGQRRLPRGGWLSAVLIAGPTDIDPPSDRANRFSRSAGPPVALWRDPGRRLTGPDWTEGQSGPAVGGEPGVAGHRHGSRIWLVDRSEPGRFASASAVARVNEFTRSSTPGVVSTDTAAPPAVEPSPISPALAPARRRDRSARSAPKARRGSHKQWRA